MLTIDNFIGIISLCVAFFSLGYSFGSHDSKTQKKQLQRPGRQSGYPQITNLRTNRKSATPFT